MYIAHAQYLLFLTFMRRDYHKERSEIRNVDREILREHRNYMSSPLLTSHNVITISASKTSSMSEK